jgi:outer membrane protein OmpA-like peptidoglycan-associated protein
MNSAKMRTDAVVKGLTGMGVKKRGISAVMQGENDPSVSGAGKKDGRNRRVVILVIY